MNEQLQLQFQDLIMTKDNDFVLPEGWAVEDFDPSHCAPEGELGHDCEGLDEDLNTEYSLGDEF